MADRLVDVFSTVRDSARERGVVSTRAVDGRLPDDPFAIAPAADGFRPLLAASGEAAYPAAQGTFPDVVIAHNLYGLLAAEKLADRVTIGAMVRNPLSLIASMMTVEPAFRREGLSPKVNELFPTLAKVVKSTVDHDARRIATVLFLFNQLFAAVPTDRVIRIEDLAATKGAALARWLPAASGLSTPLTQRDTLAPEDAAALVRMGFVLIDQPGPMWEYYQTDDVVTVMRRAADVAGFSLSI